MEEFDETTRGGGTRGGWYYYRRSNNLNNKESIRNTYPTRRTGRHYRYTHTYHSCIESIAQTIGRVLGFVIASKVGTDSCVARVEEEDGGGAW